jgi:hypothetical protein
VRQSTLRTGCKDARLTHTHIIEPIKTIIFLNIDIVTLPVYLIKIPAKLRIYS